MTVRELRFKVEQPGFRVDNVVLVTTMLDATMYSREELADLYLKRWNVEMSHPDYPSNDCLYRRHRAA